MEITSTTPTAAQLAQINAANNAQGGKQTLGADDFMKLLTVQLQSQDPLKPMEDTAFISQMASFTSLEQMRTLTQTFSDFTKSQQIADAQVYLGRTVKVSGTQGDVTGAVTGVSMESGSPQLTVNGVNYDLSAVKSITNPTTASSTTSTN